MTLRLVVLRRFTRAIEERLHRRRWALPPGYDRIYHYHVRKTAGTSLNAAFWALGGRPARGIPAGRTKAGAYVYVRVNRRMIAKGHYFYGSSHTAAYLLRLPPRTFTVVILRDPARRLLSEYSAMLYGHDWGDGPVRPGHWRETGRLDWLGDGLGDFLERAPREIVAKQLTMFSRTEDVAEAADRILACDAVLFTESFADDLARLAMRLNLPLKAPHERRSAAKYEPSEAERERLAAVLEPEYRLIERVREGLRGRDG